MTVDLDWTHRTIDLPERGLNRERAVSLDMREKIAAELGLLRCEWLVLNYNLKLIAGDAVAMTGRLNAKVTQACVVTLEPIESEIEEDISVEFHLGVERAEPPSGDNEVLTGPDIEPIKNGMIDVGRIAFETLSAALDPYPRKAGAEFSWRDSKAAASETHPFAALKKLKNQE